MIYKKEANFPFPMLINDTTSYNDSTFLLDADLEEDTYEYQFTFEFEIGSSFIDSLIENKEVKLVLIVQTKDNKVIELEKDQNSIRIPKKHISINERTSLQLHLVADKEICLKNNNDLNEFYDSFKKNILLPKYSSLGFSNIVVLEGRMKKPLELFEKRLDIGLPSEIKIELGTETIIIHYKEPEFQFNEMSKSFTNPYIYLGLNKALTNFILTYGDTDEESVSLSNIQAPDNLLDLKLYQLMQSKMVDEINVDNIDEIISRISDRIIGRYVYAVKGLTNSEN